MFGTPHKIKPMDALQPCFSTLLHLNVIVFIQVCDYCEAPRKTLALIYSNIVCIYIYSKA